ncbi:MAG: 4Fe-4S dicluster domain-containing protein [Rhodopila sp.]
MQAVCEPLGFRTSGLPPHQVRRTFQKSGRPLAARAVHCQSCHDACPEQAIRFVLRLGGPPLPQLLPSRCTDCGDCVSACPAGPIVLTRNTENG